MYKYLLPLFLCLSAVAQPTPPREATAAEALAGTAGPGMYLSPRRGTGAGTAQTIPTGASIIYVKTNGSDTTYVVGNPGLPVKTIQKAMQVAQAYSNAIIQLGAGDHYNIETPLYVTNADGTTYSRILSGQTVTIWGYGATIWSTNVPTMNTNGTLVQSFFRQESNSFLNIYGLTYNVGSTNNGNNYVLPFASPTAVANGGPYPSFFGLHDCSFNATITNSMVPMYAVDIILMKWATNMVIENCTFIGNFDQIIFQRGNNNMFCRFENNLYVSVPSTNPAVAPNATSHGPQWFGGNVLSRNNLFIIPAAQGDADPGATVYGLFLSRTAAGPNGTVMTNINDTIICPTNSINFGSGSPQIWLSGCKFLGGGIVASNGGTVNILSASEVGAPFLTASLASGSAQVLTTAIVTNIASISLPTGDWDIDGIVDYTFGGTTSYTAVQQGISTVSQTIGAADTYTIFSNAASVPTAAFDPAWRTPTVRLSVTTTSSNVFLVAKGTFSLSTLSAYGTINARRAR